MRCWSSCACSASWRDLLAYAGPVLVALTLLVWVVLMLVGWAAVCQPALGSGITRWDRPLKGLAAAMLYRWDEIEPVPA